MAGKNIFKSNQVRIVTFSLKNSSELTFSNIAYALECDSNLISLGPLQKTGISYHNELKYMILKQGGKTIGLVTRKKNMFIPNTQIPGKTMLVKGRGRPTYLLSTNPQIKFWHRRLRYASNAKVVGTSKLTNGIDIKIEDS